MLRGNLMTPASQYRNLPRRRFSREFKREVVELLNEEAATVAEVARTYDLHPNQLFRWRREYSQGAYGPIDARQFSPAVLLPVVMETDKEPLTALAEAKPSYNTAGSEPVGITSLSTVKVVLRKGQLHLEDVNLEILRLLIEALK